jgi:hypothetical protein
VFLFVLNWFEAMLSLLACLIKILEMMLAYLLSKSLAREARDSGRTAPLLDPLIIRFLLTLGEPGERSAKRIRFSPGPMYYLRSSAIFMLFSFKEKWFSLTRLFF